MKRPILYLLAVLPALHPLLLILIYGVDFPFWDQWMPDLGGVILKAHDHTLTLADLASQHNEHRFLMPRLIYVPLALLTHWNVRAEMLAEWVIVCLSSLFILRLIRFTWPGDRRVPGYWLISNILIFNIVQFENWLWGVGVANVLPMFFILLAITILTTTWKPWPKVLAVILCGFAATFSSGNGILCWPIAVMLFGYSDSIRELKSKLPHLMSIIVGGVLTLALYFIGYMRPPQSAPIAFHPLASLRYFLAFLGNPFAFISSFDPVIVSSIVAIPMLALSLLAIAYLLQSIRSNRELAYRMLIWLTIASFPILSAAMASLTRAGPGPQQALASRYVAYSLYLPLAITMLLGLMIDDRKSRRSQPARTAQRLSDASSWIFPAIIAILLLQGLRSATADAVEFASRQKAFRDAILNCEANPSDPILGSIETLSANDVIQTAKRLNEIGYLRPPLRLGDESKR